MFLEESRTKVPLIVISVTRSGRDRSGMARAGNCILGRRRRFVRNGDAGASASMGRRIAETVRQQKFPELTNAPGDARLDRANGQIKNFGDVFVGIILQIEKRHSGLIDPVDSGQRAQNLRMVRLTGGLCGKNRQLVRHRLQFMVGEPGLPPPRSEEGAMQRREEPAFDLGEVSQLMSFLRPDAECLLSQIACVGFEMRQAHRKSEQWFVVLAHNRFKLIGRIHGSFGCSVSKKFSVPIFSSDADRHNGTKEQPGDVAMGQKNHA